MEKYSPKIEYDSLMSRLTDYKERIDQRKIVHHSLEDAEDFCQCLHSKYRRIVPIGIEFVGIGETLVRVGAFIRDKETRNQDELWVVLPTFFDYYRGGLCNDAFFEIFKNEIVFITPDTIELWIYAVKGYQELFDFNLFYLYRARSAKEVWVGINAEKFEFDSEEIDACKRKLKEMGIEKEYICIHAREQRTKNAFIDYEGTHNADFNLDSLNLVCEYYQKRNIKTIRMGKDEIEECNLPNCVDYAHDYYEPRMDFYLIGNCKFMIGCASGVSTIAPAWGRPLLMTNVTMLHSGFEEVMNTKHDMFIPKKFYSKKKGRLLNYYESLEISEECDRVDKEFEYKDIVLINNSPEEILAATIEMEARINGTWEETKEELELMSEYRKQCQLFKKSHTYVKGREKAYNVHNNPSYKGYVMIPLRISYTYLKENRYLIE